LRSWADIIRFLWLSASFLRFHAPCELSHPASTPGPMPRERGRPRRGSPWRPRRPSFSPPGSQPHSLAIVPWVANTPPRPCSASTEPIPVLPPVVDPPRSSSEGPPPPRRPGNYDHQNPVSSTGVQLRDSLENIYGLVFELRQGVDDLHFRVHSTNDKVGDSPSTPGLHERDLSLSPGWSDLRGDASHSNRGRRRQGTERREAWVGVHHLQDGKGRFGNSTTAAGDAEAERAMDND
jgi:hypothetical protein